MRVVFGADLVQYESGGASQSDLPGASNVGHQREQKTSVDRERAAGARWCSLNVRAIDEAAPQVAMGSVTKKGLNHKKRK